jgi:hypothetical protein
MIPYRHLYSRARGLALESGKRRSIYR